MVDKAEVEILFKKMIKGYQILLDIILSVILKDPYSLLF